MYPRYFYFPRWQPAPEWVEDLCSVFRDCRPQLDSTTAANRSDQALEILRPGLETMGFKVEVDKTRGGRLFRPVFFRENGVPDRYFAIDAYHAGYHIALEVEAARAVQGNAVYRDLIQMSLMVGVDYGVIAVPQEYRYTIKGRRTVNPAYESARSILEAVYGGRRLELPLKGLLLLGY